MDILVVGFLGIFILFLLALGWQILDEARHRRMYGQRLDWYLGEAKRSHREEKEKRRLT